MDIPLYDIDCQSYLAGTHSLRFGLIFDQMERLATLFTGVLFPHVRGLGDPMPRCQVVGSTCTPLSQVRILVSVSPSSPAKIVWYMHLTEYHDYIVLMCM